MAWYVQDAELIVKLPTDLASDIVEDGAAEALIPIRGPLFDGTVELVVEGINVASAAVSVGMGLAAVRRFGQSVIQKLRARGRSGQIELRMPSTDGERRLTIDLDDPDAEGKILDFVIEALPEAAPQREDSGPNE